LTALKGCQADILAFRNSSRSRAAGNTLVSNVHVYVEELFEDKRRKASVKYEEAYLHEYTTVKMAIESLGAYFALDNLR
jgi:hypothetical protein